MKNGKRGISHFLLSFAYSMSGAKFMVKETGFGLYGYSCVDVDFGSKSHSMFSISRAIHAGRKMTGGMT